MASSKVTGVKTSLTCSSEKLRQEGKKCQFLSVFISEVVRAALPSTRYWKLTFFSCMIYAFVHLWPLEKVDLLGGHSLSSSCALLLFFNVFLFYWIRCSKYVTNKMQFECVSKAQICVAIVYALSLFKCCKCPFNKCDLLFEISCSLVRYLGS